MSVALAYSAPPAATDHAGRPDPLPDDLLRDIASGLAAAEDLWRPHARHDDRHRQPVRLTAADRWEAWVIGWTAGQRVELHDHGDAAGALVVVEGSLVDVRRRHDVLHRRELPTGSTTSLPVGLVHDVVGSSVAATTSIHVYSPSITSMTFYDATDGRQVRTVDVPEEPPVTDLRRAARALHPAAHRG